MGEDAEDDEEDDEGGDPGPELVDVDDFVAEEGHEPGADCDDDDAGVAWDVAVYGVEELGADDGVDGRPWIGVSGCLKAGSGGCVAVVMQGLPSDTCQNVEDGNELHTPPSEPEARKHHLPQAESRPKCREEADDRQTDDVEEQDDEHCICDTQKEQ